MTSFGEIPWVPLPFATYDVNKTIALGKDDVEMNHWFTDGLSPKLGTPQKNGIALTRHHLNKIGFAATIGCFLDQCGYQPGFDHMPVGGWPKGAIITDTTGSQVKEWVNTIENNQTIPDELSSTEAKASNYWRPLWGARLFDFFPEFENEEEVWSNTFTSPIAAITQEITNTGSAWFKIVRTWEKWDAIVDSKETLSQSGSSIDIFPYMKVNGSDEIKKSYAPIVTIANVEGATVSRLFPMTGSFSISIPKIETNRLGKLTVSVVRYPTAQTEEVLEAAV